MEEMTREEFLRQKTEAEMRMRSLYGGRDSTRFPNFVAVSESEKDNVKREQKNLPEQHRKEPHSAPLPSTGGRRLNPPELFKFINLPELIKSPDGLLILGLIFLLLSDNADEILIMALVFIML